MMQRKKKSAVKSQRSKPTRKAGTTRPGKALSPKRRGTTSKDTVSPPSAQPEITGLEPEPPHVDDAQLRRTDEMFRDKGYLVDNLGESGRVVYPSGTPVRVLDPDAEPSVAEELLVTIDRRLRQVPDSDPICQYDTVMEILLDRMKHQGPLRPADYRRVYTELDLRHLYDRVYNPGGSFPQLTCRECGRMLKKRQRIYCSRTCQKAYQTQKFRVGHPEHKLHRKS